MDWIACRRGARDRDQPPAPALGQVDRRRHGGDQGNQRATKYEFTAHHFSVNWCFEGAANTVAAARPRAARHPWHRQCRRAARNGHGARRASSRAAGRRLGATRAGRGSIAGKSSPEVVSSSPDLRVPRTPPARARVPVEPLEPLVEPLRGFQGSSLPFPPWGEWRGTPVWNPWNPGSTPGGTPGGTPPWNPGGTPVMEPSAGRPHGRLRSGGVRADLRCRAGRDRAARRACARRSPGHTTRHASGSRSTRCRWWPRARVPSGLDP